MQSKQGSGLPSGLIEAYEKTRYTVDDSVIPPLLTAVKSRGLGRLRLHGWWYAANG